MFYFFILYYHIMKRNFLSLLVLMLPLLLSAQYSPFSFATSLSASEDHIPLTSYDLLLVDVEQLQAALSNVPAERALGSRAFYLDLPTPAGEFLSVRLEDSPIMHPALAARYPQLKSYRAYSDYGSGRIAVSPFGVMAVIMGPEGEYFINRAAEGQSIEHLIYYTKDLDTSLGGDALALPSSSCGWDADQAEDEALLQWQDRVEAGAGRSMESVLGLKVYDFALVCTGEFAIIKGGTLVGVLNAYNEAMTALNGVLEREVAIRLMLLANIEALIYLNPNTDPFNNANNGGELLSQVAPAIALAGITESEYDLGHLFTAGCTDVGGVVSGRACTSGKARGVTCNSSSNIAAIARGVMAHEIAHQFAVGHSWSNCPGSDGQLASGSAFEPGSGTTIMSYAGACGNQNIGGRNAYYHVGSLDQFINYSRVTVAGCGTTLEPINNEPAITLLYEDGFHIPISTPFALHGIATDADGDELLFNWEQFDLGPTSSIGNPFGNAPIFRSFAPSTDGNTRFFPRMDLIVNNNNSNAEVLPTYSRALTFRLTARDQNQNAGAAVWETVAFRAAAEAGPFLVTSPNENTTPWVGGEYKAVSWDVANTNLPPVNCQSVHILLSEDGGYTYPITLAENAPNNGQTFVTVPPNLDGENFRIKVEAADNIFFDISNQDFAITPPTTPGFTLVPDILGQQICLPDVATITFATSSILDFDSAIGLAIVSELPEGITASFTNDEVSPGASTSLALDMSNLSYSGRLEVVIQATAAGVDTTYRTILFDIVDNDFSDLTIATPAEGTLGISLATPFSWAAAANADRYDFQIATNPSFSTESLFETASAISSTAYNQEEFFLPNSLYFWRLRPINDCGPGPWIDPASFRTINAQCNTYTATDTPILLPGSGPSYTRTSTIFVEQVGAISDLNIPSIVLNYQVVRYITATLISPEGTRVKLYSENCFSTGDLDIGFDDDAPNNISCPPNDRRVLKPVENLSAFIGENTFGIWTLEIAVSQTGGAAGGLSSWNIEFCADVNAVAPSLILNNLTECPPDAGTNIQGEVLRVEDPSFGPSQVSYTLVRAPLNGFLSRNGNELLAGTTFTQQQISNNQIFYRNTNPAASEDNFLFVVQNPDGGYIPVTRHEINIYEGAPTNLADAFSPQGLLLFPNPVSQQLQLRWQSPIGQDIPLALYDIAGKQLINQQVPARLTDHTLDMQNLPSGVYFLRLGNKTHKVVKQ